MKKEPKNWTGNIKNPQRSEWDRINNWTGKIKNNLEEESEK